MGVEEFLRGLGRSSRDIAAAASSPSPPATPPAFRAGLFHLLRRATLPRFRMSRSFGFRRNGLFMGWPALALFAPTTIPVMSIAVAHLARRLVAAACRRLLKFVRFLRIFQFEEV